MQFEYLYNTQRRTQFFFISSQKGVDMRRRDFLSLPAAFGAVRLLGGDAFQRSVVNCAYAEEPSKAQFPPCRRLTNGPLFHWGAYYDQIHFDPTNRYVIGNEVNFEGRSPTPDDSINVGFIDTEDGDRWTQIGSTKAWNWQQGCMLQFIPGDSSEVVWNNRGEKDFYATVFDVKTGRSRTLPKPVYALAPNGDFTVFPDFRRLNDTRPGYGYCGIPDPNADVCIPDNAGIGKMNLETGQHEQLFSFADVASIPRKTGEPFPEGVKHWFNHLIVSPDSQRFLFLHRWKREPGASAWYTRLCTAKNDGSDIRIISDNLMVSHLVWRDPTHIIAFARNELAGDRFYLFDTESDNVEVYGKDVMTVDGHVSYLPNTNFEWLLNDTYPNKERLQTPFLFELKTERKILLGSFYSDKKYAGEWRCDLHPRASRDGRKILIDSVHEDGRQIYMIERPELS